jgi:hypothetical protein
MAREMGEVGPMLNEGVGLVLKAADCDLGHDLRYERI